MSGITTHVLDTSRGRPAEGIMVKLEQLIDGEYREIGRGITDSDGRIKALLAPEVEITRAKYRLTFQTNVYFAGQHVEGFYPEVTVNFSIRDPSQHYHVPLLLSPFGYSTYRGS